MKPTNKFQDVDTSEYCEDDIDEKETEGYQSDTDSDQMETDPCPPIYNRTQQLQDGLDEDQVPLNLDRIYSCISPDFMNQLCEECTKLEPYVPAVIIGPTQTFISARMKPAYLSRRCCERTTVLQAALRTCAYDVQR